MRSYVVALSLYLLCVPASIGSAQVYYLSPVDGSGTETDPYHSRCRGLPGGNNIDLREIGIDSWLCTSDALPVNMAGVVPLGTSLASPLPGATKLLLDGVAKKKLSASTFHGVITELVTPKLRPGRDGKIKIWFGGHTPIYQRTSWSPIEDGGLLADAANALLKFVEPAVAWAASVAETFNCANSASLTCTLTWTEFNGTTWEISGSHAQSNSISSAHARADSAVSTQDHEVKATLGAYSETGSGFTRCGVLGRKDSTATLTLYTFFADFDGTLFETAKQVSSTHTSIATNIQNPAQGDVLTLRVDGSSVSGYVNGALVIGPSTDLSIDNVANTYGGVYSRGNGTTLLCVLDDWSISDLQSRRLATPWVMP